MFNIFKRRSSPQVSAVYSNLDGALYPFTWQGKSIQSPRDLLTQSLQESVSSIVPLQKEFSELLQSNSVYQDWINFTVFGRYVQRSFSVFYAQEEDVFNADMPEFLRYQLMRHTQRLPKGQVLFSGGILPTIARQEKLLFTTLNPFQAITDAQNQHKFTHNKRSNGIKINTSLSKNTKPIVTINLMTISSDQVKAFAIKHNKRTRERLRNEVMVLEFTRLVLTKEESFETQGQSDYDYLIRHYSLG